MIKKSSKTNPIITMKIKKEFGEYIIIKKKKKIKNIKKLFEVIINSDIPIPNKIILSRLINLNKDSSQTCILNKIRSISVYGPIIKLLEKCIYKDLYEQVIKKINICQICFIGYLEQKLIYLN